MLKKILESLSFHKEGFKTLKLIHKADSSAIPVYMLHSLINSLYPFISIFFSAYIIDTIFYKHFDKTVYGIIGLVVGNLLFGIILDMLKKAVNNKAAKINYFVQIAIRKNVLDMDYSILENPKTLDLLNTADFAMQHNGSFGMLLSNYGLILESIISVIVSVGIVIDLCLHSPASDNNVLNTIASIPASFIILGLFLIAFIYTNMSVEKHFNNKSIEIYKTHMKAERRFSYFFSQIILDFAKGKVIRLFNMKDMIINEESTHIDFLINNIYKKMFAIQNNKAYTNTAINGFSIVFAYTFSLIKIFSKAITIGGLTKYISTISQLSNSLSQLLKYNDDIRVQCEYMKCYNNFMDIKSICQTGTIPIEKRNDNVYEIEFHDVSFSYAGRTEKVLDHVNCKLTLKNKMAVVGRNGAGKTTFIKLLCRLYEPTDGYITLNGVDIRKYNYYEYLSLFGIVFQDFNLFAFPLEQNVSSSLTPDEEKLWDCLELAGIKDRVDRMPQKLKTPLYKYDEGGVEISGGEAQKIAIARALYKDAPFVILDEPTAALDPISEYEIYSRFDELVKDKTSIYISHRMSSCRFCDDIIVFDKGTIIQRGSHDKLIQDEDLTYAQLWNAQAKYYVQ